MVDYRAGSGNGRAKLTEQQVREIIDLLIEGDLSSIEIAERYGVSQPSIINIKSNKTWRHIPRERIHNRSVRDVGRRVSDEQVRTIRKMCSAGQTDVSVAEQMGVTRQVVRGIRKGLTYKDVV